jgi:hypothetical protein
LTSVDHRWVRFQLCGLPYGLIQGVIAARQLWGWELGIGYFLLINLHGLWAIIDVIRDRAREIVVQKDRQ